MVFEALAFLRPVPIHEEPEGAMHRRNGDHHIDRDADGGDSSEESQNQSQAAEELGGDRQEGEWGRNMHRARKETHGSGEAETSEPPQHFLRAMREEDGSKHES